MKVFIAPKHRVISALLILLSSVSAQTPPEPELQILRFGWSNYRTGNLGLETGMASAGDRNSPPPSKADATLEVLGARSAENKDAIAALEEQKRLQQRLEQANIHSDKNPTPQSRYKYSLEVKNASRKQIAEVQWDHVFSDPRTRQEVFRYHFARRTEIKPDKSAKLAVYSSATPYAVVSADKSRTQESERVVIRKIIYADGSVWVAR